MFIATRPWSSPLYAEAAPRHAARIASRSSIVVPGCDVRRKTRVFVGFSDDMSLDDFELAAVQAERLLRVIKPQVCVAWSQGAARSPLAASLDATLRRALSAHATVHILDVYFASQRLRAADVHLSSAVQGDADTSNQAGQRWLARLARTGAGWRVVRVVVDTTAK